MPFDIKLSLARVFEFWESKATNGTPSEQIYAKSILESVAHVPELRQAISDISVIEKYRNEIEALLSAMFPEILTNNEVKAASLPFFPVLFNMSNRLKTLITGAGPDFKMALRGYDDSLVYIMACAFLMAVAYKVPINLKRQLYFDIPDQKTGIIRHFRAFINGEFSKITPKENHIPLTKEDIQLLLDNSNDVELWKKMIPPGTYEFEGVALVTMFDQTEDESLSELKQLLLENNALQIESTLNKLQDQLAIYLGTEKIEIGFQSFDESNSVIKALQGTARQSKLLGTHLESTVSESFCDYSKDALLKRRDFFSVSNVNEQKNLPSRFIKRMYEASVGSFIVAPLKVNDEIIAFIELTSPHQGVLNSMVASRLNTVVPMFTVAVSRSIDHHQMELEAIIQDKFTALHPAVTWKFLKAADTVFQNRVAGRSIDIDEFSFQDVYPLYGQFDIRGSSDARNESIQADLKEQLSLAGKVLDQAIKFYKLPIYQQLQFRINQFSSALDEAIHAGDEIKILDFMHRELDPVLEFLNSQSHTSDLVQKYRKSLDPKLGVIYHQRKDYEHSVTMINERISQYIDQQQVLAQGMFPHYFEKYKTDGVEYNAYIGQSLVQSQTFHPLHLKNMRLWQLLITCGVHNLHQSYKDELPVPLDITSLILAHSNLLAIRFRMDEKRFDVDGAYNIRYEILKKRIDKAYIKGTTERLTQPGKLAIVYSQDWEAEEYLQYIHYLQSINYLDDKIERLEIQDLQGTTGLQALRVSFNAEVTPELLIKEMMQEVAS